ncbi:uncharacterized protein LOC124283711 [Haliotis rubra]|uniref:uncharacterized protein LOC124283711 n=1 Tax=Haliotis rubra TaxID=36100 RepID=UPI001EE580C1|nr:uncharacterized protein LOC124283711 [Haliotis rubra]
MGFLAPHFTSGIMEAALRSAFTSESLNCPVGLEHIVFHTGKKRKDVYRALYGALVYGEKLAPPGTTLVYPTAVREAVRGRFPEETSGKYDDQYLTKGRHVTLAEIASLKLRVPQTCAKCRATRPAKPERTRSSTAPY